MTHAIVVPWHPVDNPECSNCHGLARSVRPKRSKPYDCPNALPQLGLGLALARAKAAEKAQQEARQRLNDLAFQSALPKEDLAELLHINVSTLWRMQNGVTPIRPATMRLLRNIVHIERQGNYTHVVHQTRTPSPRWDYMQKRRARSRKTPLHMQCVQHGEMKC